MRSAFAAVAATVVVAVIATGVAVASFTNPRAAAQVVAGATIPTGPTPSASASGSTVTLSFTGITLGDGRAMTSYLARRLDASNNVIASDLACGTVSGGCSLSSVPDGTWKFAVRGVYGTWSGAYGNASGTVTVSTVALTISTLVRDASKKVHFTGSGAVAATNIVVTICGVNSFPCPSPVATSTASNPAAGTWTSGTSDNSLSNNTTYYARATQGSTTSNVLSFQL